MGSIDPRFPIRLLGLGAICLGLIGAVFPSPIKPWVPADLRLEAQESLTSAQSNRNEKTLQRQINLKEAPPLPGATETIQVPVSGQATDSKGNKVTITGTVTVTLEANTTPPPPVGTVLSGVRDKLSGQLVTTATPGMRLVLEGTKLINGDELFTIALGGEKATVVTATDTAIDFVAPTVPPNKPPVLILYWLVNNAWVEKGRLPFQVSVIGPPPPPGAALPRVDGYKDALGNPVSSIFAGSELSLVGMGFGRDTGVLWLDSLPTPVIAWSDTAIKIKARAAYTVGIMRNDGEYVLTSDWGFPNVITPVVGSKR